MPSQLNIPHSVSVLCVQSRLVGAPPKLVARLAAQTSQVALRVLQLKDCFPTADVSAMLNNRLTLLLDDDIEKVRDAGHRLRSALPDIDVDRWDIKVYQTNCHGHIAG